MKNIKEILIKVENGQLTSKEAADILRNLPHTDEQIKYAKKMKIRIHDRKENKKINLPVIPIWIIESLALFGLKFMNYFHKERNTSMIKEREKFNANNDYQGSYYLKYGKIKIDTKDLKKIFLVLRHIPPCKIVEVDDKDAFVEIHMI